MVQVMWHALSEHLFSANGRQNRRKSALYYHHHDGDLYQSLIGALPTYAQIGFCPHLAGDAAYYSGVGAGAEISGAGTMLAEYAPKVSAELSPHLWLGNSTAEP